MRVVVESKFLAVGIRFGRELPELERVDNNGGDFAPASGGHFEPEDDGEYLGFGFGVSNGGRARRLQGAG